MPEFDPLDTAAPVSDEAVYRQFLADQCGISDPRLQRELWAAERAKRLEWERMWTRQE